MSQTINPEQQEPGEAPATGYGQLKQSWDQNYVDNTVGCKEENHEK